MRNRSRTSGLAGRVRSRSHGVRFADAGLVLAMVACLGLGVPATLATPGTQLWVSHYDETGSGNEFPDDLAVSPEGSKVFVTGDSRSPVGSPGRADYATVAYDSSTGAAVWAKRYNGPANREDSSAALAMSPDGTKVFVTGASNGSTSGADYATVGYDTSTGARLWMRRYNGPANRDDIPAAVSVSPDGSKVLVTGSADVSTSGSDYATVAYSASNGAQLWVKRYNGPARGRDFSRDLDVGSGGSKVFVTGDSDGPANSMSRKDYATVAYDTTRGTQLWVRRYDGPAHRDDSASALATSPSGGRVFVTGRSYGPSTTGYDYTTVAYNAATGEPVWVKRYDGPASVPGTDTARALSVSPDGSKVFVTGDSQGATPDVDYATVAYKPATGAPLWVRRYAGPENQDDLAFALDVSPDGSGLFVTGYSWGSSPTEFDYATLAYNTASGATLWTRRYNGPANKGDYAVDLGASADGSKLFVTGGSPASTSSGQDFTTLAYSIP
jgi:hypothetical protein